MRGSRGALRGPAVRIPRGWELPERLVTPERVYTDRRNFLKAIGIAGASVFGLTACARLENDGPESPLDHVPEDPLGVYPAKRNPKYVAGRLVTSERVAASYNNFYEFTEKKDRVWRLVGGFEPRPWTVEIAGLVRRPRMVDLDALVRKLPLEERNYRFRCVEAWSMVIPWTGFPMKALVDWAEPLSSARYVRLVGFLRPEQAPNQARPSGYPWPYYEGLTMAEARNELTLLVTGIYGHALTKQHGAPIRLMTPWKYGFKNIKSIVRIEFTDRRPRTLWSDLAPSEYDFTANVDPTAPHPRWSQAIERVVETGERIKTLPYNGYGEYVASLYKS